MHVAILDALQSESGDQRSTHTTAILGSQNLDWVILIRVLLLGPIKDLSERLCTTGFEVRVLVKYRTVGANMARVIALLLADSSHSASRETGRPSTDEFGGAANKLEFWAIGVDVELVLEQFGCLRQVLERVPA